MARFSNQGLDHVAIGVADVARSASFHRDVVGLARAHEAFEAARAELDRREIETRLSDHGISHSLYFEDPDGHQLELTTYEV